MKKVFLFSFILSLFIIGCGSEPTNQENNELSISTPENTVDIIDEKVEINGVEHYIKKMGEGDPIVVLHGGPGLFHNYLVPHFKNLAEKYQIIFYDQRGCGQTDFPKDTTSINIDTYVEDLEAIRNHLKLEKLTLLGHSWGALLALKYGIKHPQNLNKLLLVAPAPSNTSYFDETFANMQQKRSEEDTKELIQAMMSKKFENREEETFRKVVLLGDKPNLYEQSKIEELYNPMTFTKESANSLLIVNSLLERTYFNFDITQEGINTINCPTIILMGGMDNVPFASAQAIQDNMSNCELKVFKKTCHYPFFEVPGEFTSTVDKFLNPEYEQ